MMQKRVYNRAQAEAEFAHAFTRQIGYTAGAFSIRRMASIVSIFNDASAYQFELIKRLTAVGSSNEALTEKYATDVLNFAGELGIISKIPGASAPHLSKYILTDAGVAIRAARAIADSELEQLVLEHLILENDADAYLRALWLLNKEPDNSAEAFAINFRNLILLTRQARLSWMQIKFPSKPIMMRLVKGSSAHIHWIKVSKIGKIEPERPGTDFGRHHFAPRKSWASELAHLDVSSKALTQRGIEFLECTQSHQAEIINHWISPPEECLNFLRIPPGGDLFGGKAPTIDLLRPKSEECEISPDLIVATVDFLKTAFEHIRLVHARQAFISPIVYFLLKYERFTQKRYNLDALLQTVARTHGRELAFFSSRSGTLAYYQLRK